MDQTIFQLESLIVNAINDSLTIDCLEYKEKLKNENFDTKTSLPFYFRDSYNKRLRDVLPPYVIWYSFRRGSWECRVIIDTRSKNVYSILGKKNLNRIRKKHKKQGDKNKHYTCEFLRAMNGDLVSKTGQVSLFHLEDKQLEDDNIASLDSICSDIDLKDCTYHIVEVDSVGNFIKTIRCLTFDKNFELVNERNLTEYINVNYDQFGLANIGSIEITDTDNITRPINVRLKENVLDIDNIKKSNNSKVLLKEKK